MAAEPQHASPSGRGATRSGAGLRRLGRARTDRAGQRSGMQSEEDEVFAMQATPNERRASSGAERDAFGTILGRVLRTGGFRFDDDTMSRLRGAIWERVRASGAGSAQAYLSRLDDPAELDQIHAVIAVRGTRFFRTPAQFELLSEDLLPALWFRRGSDTRLLLWSAGSASGEEAYSLAIVALEAAIRCGVPLAEPAHVIGSDTDGAALRVAEDAVYGERALANVGPAVRSRYFTRFGGDWRVAETPRRLVEFQRWSLLDAAWPLRPGSVDVLLCHDVLPFFTEADQELVVERFCEALAPGGYLFLGHGEALTSVPATLEEVSLPSASFYQKLQRP
ncbi:MAG TPA: CheR family methyltransferase [Dehalococcoidia bacterium]|nr:CheR family methyltransferase [Dehalococcoidia bacterium]